MQSTDPSARYWDTLRRELSWPFAPNGVHKGRHYSISVTQRLRSVVCNALVPFHELCLATGMRPELRDALGLLTVVATTPAARDRANPKSPWSPWVELDALASWTSDQPGATGNLGSGLALAAELGLVVVTPTHAGATSKLVELVTGEPWRSIIPGGTWIRADLQSHVGVADANGKATACT